MSKTAHSQSQAQQPTSRRSPGILRLLPETLPFYPYHETDNKPLRIYKKKTEKRDDESGSNHHVCDMLPSKPLHMVNTTDDSSSSFTLFFFVDSTNRQSLMAVPKVSKWFDCVSNIGQDSRVICIPNYPSPHEIKVGDSSSDPIIQANINSSITKSVTRQQQVIPMMLNTGFYLLPFIHPKRLPLIHMLGATRVPSVVVVSNDSGRIITRYGWEAIEKESKWIESNWIDNKKDREGEEHSSRSTEFESQVVKDWGNGKSGLPLWWHLLGWIM